MRARHYSRRTEKAYVASIRHYILFHRKRHPSEMGAPELTRYLSSLAVEGNVAASTQNQALLFAISTPLVVAFVGYLAYEVRRLRHAADLARDTI